MRVLEKQTLTIKDRNGKTNEEFGTFIPMNDFGMHTQKDALKYSLLALDAIEVTNRLNLFLKEFDKKPIDTGIFYRLLASIVERKDFTQDDQRQYFEVVKALHNYSEPFYYINNNIHFTPRYELDMLVLGIPYSDEVSDKYASLHYNFTYENATFEELLKQAKQLTNNQRQSPE